MREGGGESFDLAKFFLRRAMWGVGSEVCRGQRRGGGGWGGEIEVC